MEKETEGAMVARELGITTGKSDPNGKDGVDKGSTTTTTTEQNPYKGAQEQNKGAETVFEIRGKKQTTKVKDEGTKAGENGKQPTDKGGKTDFNEENYLNERFGKKSVAEIKAAIQKAQDQEELLKVSPYSSEEIRQLDELVGKKKMSLQDAVKYLNADPAKLSPREAMVMGMRQEYPNVSEEQINRRIDKKYKLGEFAVGDTPEEKQAAEKDALEELNWDAQPYVNKLAELKAKMVDGGENRNTVQAKQAERQRQEAWKPALSKVFDGFMDIQEKLPNGATLKYAVEMEPEEKTELMNELNNFIQIPGFVADEKGIKAVQDFVRNRYIIKNFTKIATAFAEQTRSMTEKEWTEFIHNPSLANTTGRDHNRGSDEGDRDDKLISAIERGGRGKQRNPR